VTGLYPRERVEVILRPLRLTIAHRILLKAFLPEPFDLRPARSRFCDGRSYAVLYAAGDFETAFAEVVMRDRFVQRDQRVVAFGELSARAWMEITQDDGRLLNLADLRDDGCLVLGAPTDAVHARNHAAGRALSRALHDEHTDVDGIVYRSRLTGGDCYAIFDRATASLVSARTGELPNHPELPDVLRKHQIYFE